MSYPTHLLRLLLLCLTLCALAEPTLAADKKGKQGKKGGGKKQEEPITLTEAEALAEMETLQAKAEELKPTVDALNQKVNEAKAAWLKDKSNQEANSAYKEARNASRKDASYKEYGELQKRIGRLRDHVRTGRALELGKTIVKKRDDGLLQVVPPTVAPEFNNPWPPEQEEWFVKHYNTFLDQHRELNKGIYFNTFFENEKHGYGIYMGKFLAEPTGADYLAKLQDWDVQAGEWHKHTLGIDWYACFTIKHQTRKYFQFGEGLAPDYKQLMYDSAKIWTEKDPLRRKHYAYKGGGPGWGPDVKNSWVDVRRTDNLMLMRIQAVYLMAEETGNAATAAIYKERFKRFVVTLYRAGNGEWDSHNYLAHATAPIHNLFDFAKDPEMKLLAKAALDWYYLAAAKRYWRGNWCGPNKRDYNAIGPMQGSAEMFSVMFGGNTLPVHKLHGDEPYPLASAYRPPMAVMKFAARDFPKPMTVYSNYPFYEAAMTGTWKRAPSYYGTTTYGEHYQFGTLAGGTQEADANGFCILVEDAERGAEIVGMVPGPDAYYTGSPKYVPGKLVGRSRVLQHENSAIYLNNVGDAPWSWRAPLKAQHHMEKGILFMQAEKAWLAFLPINTEITGYDAEKTDKQVQHKYKEKKVKEKDLKSETKPKWLAEAIAKGRVRTDDKGQSYAIQKQVKYPEYYAASAKGKGGKYCGIAVEIGEPRTHKSFADFKQAILTKAKVDTSKLDRGQVFYTDTRGRVLDLTFGPSIQQTRYVVDGKARSYDQPWIKYANADPAKLAPVRQAWGGGTLYVEAGGEAFACTVEESGKVSFANGMPEAVKAKIPAAALEPKPMDLGKQ